MKNNRGKGLAGLLIALCAVALFGFFGYDSADDIKLGLDLDGGVSITYQAVGETPTAEQMSDTRYKLQKRVEAYSTEAEVYLEGADRINIDIPGVNDANAILEALGKPGSLIFMDMQGNTILTGDQVESAEAGIIDSQTGNKEYVVSLRFKPDGQQAFADATSQMIGQQIAIVYDGEIISAPQVKEAITGGECTIDGMASFEEAETLASLSELAPYL